MFEFFRTHRRWMQFILLLLIIPSFALFGVSSYERFMNGEPTLAEVAGQDIKQSEFDQAHRALIEQERQSKGVQFDPTAFDTPALREALLVQMINSRLLGYVAAKDHFSVSDATLRNTIAADSTVQDSNGKFSPELYRQVLVAQGTTPARFEAGLRSQLAVGIVLDPIGISSMASNTEVAALVQALTQQRTVQFKTFAAADFRDKVQVSDADIKAWYDANASALQVPDQVQVQYLVLDEAAASQGIQVKDEDIASYYKQNQARFGAERRRLSHILIAVAPGASEADKQAARARAEAIAKQAAADPDKFAELAKTQSQDAGSAAKGGDLGWSAPPYLEQAAAALKQGQVSGVVQSDAGFHVLKVTEYQPANIKPLAEVRDTVVAEIRRQMAAARFADMATQLTKLVYDQRDSLQPAAEALGLKLREASGITRNGLLPAAQSSPDADLLGNPRVRQELFSPDVLRDKANSGVIEVSPSTLVVARVLSLTPAHVPPLAEVQDDIRARLVAQGASQAAAKAGDDALKALQAAAGQTANAAAQAGFGAEQTVSRGQPGQLKSSPDLLTAVMRMTPPAAGQSSYAGVPVGPDYVLVRLSRVEPGKVTDDEIRGMSDQLADALGQAQTNAALEVLRQQYKVKILPEAQKALAAESP